MKVEPPPPDTFAQTLQGQLGTPRYLSPEERDGGWRQLFPELARSLPRPYPIFTSDEEAIVSNGYAVLQSSGMWQLRQEIERQVDLETEFRCATTIDGKGDKTKVMIQRDRYLKAVSGLLENALLNEYGRGFAEILLLCHSNDIAQALTNVQALIARRDAGLARRCGTEFRYAIAGVFADLLQRANQTTVERLKGLAEAATPPQLPGLVSVLCQDPLLLAETKTPETLEQVDELLVTRYKTDAAQVTAMLKSAGARLIELVRAQPQLAIVLRHSAQVDSDLRDPSVLLHQSFLEVIQASGIAEGLGLSADQVSLLGEVGLRLKCCELVCALRQVTYSIRSDKTGLEIASVTPAQPIAASTRPFDFCRPGVLDSAVRRFGLVYDLSNFTELLEGVRKKGPKAEDEALRFMYIFQNRLDEIRRRRRLTFEKFLGDGAFYSSRRAHRIFAAACEIHLLYDELRQSGFPFDQGMRIAVNYSTYRLLPMHSQGRAERHFEFFGHGIVELARLTTGKSTREVENIAEFLVHSGYDPAQVDEFLRPMMTVRQGRKTDALRPYAATIDDHGELINEGIVVTIPFLEELESAVAQAPWCVAQVSGFHWLVLPLDPEDPATLYAGLRFLGVARLKGLAPVELLEATVWRQRPEELEELDLRRRPRVIDLVRHLAQKETEKPRMTVANGIDIPEDLVVATFLEGGGNRRWIFGEYRDGDDVLLHAIRVPISPPNLEDGEPLETWVFRNRTMLATKYEEHRQESSGQSLPLPSLRRRPGYVGCFLAAPHRAP